MQASPLTFMPLFVNKIQKPRKSFVPSIRKRKFLVPLYKTYTLKLFIIDIDSI